MESKNKSPIERIRDVVLYIILFVLAALILSFVAYDRIQVEVHIQTMETKFYLMERKLNSIAYDLDYQEADNGGYSELRWLEAMEDYLDVHYATEYERVETVQKKERKYFRNNF